MSLTISRILHAGYVFESSGTRVLFDPIFENPFGRNCHAFPDVRFDHAGVRRQRFDAVFISHYHDDHCSFGSLDLLDRQTPVYLYCVHEEMFGLLTQLGFTDVHALKLGVTVRIGGVDVTALRAFDADVDAIFHVAAGGVNVLNVVDALIDDDTLPDLVARARWDVVLWPFQTLRELAVLAPTLAEPAPPRLPPEFLAQLRALAPRMVVPSSCQFIHEAWSWLNHAMFPVSYAQFAREVGDVLPDARVWRLDPSCAIRIDEDGVTPAPALDWVIPVGPRDVDYAYDPGVIPTPVADVARRFDALAEDAAARVDRYCRVELAARYRELEPADEGSFAQPRVWCLSVYDHRGRPTRYHFRVTGQGMRPLPADAAADWTTEIAAAKLYAALARGEALTSLYLRVVAAPAGADVLEDPLVRCLFTGVFGAYQRAQLRTLSSARERATTGPDGPWR